VWRSVRHTDGCGCWAQYRVVLGKTNTLTCVCCRERFRVNL
jgi:SH3-like domain-containing protein